MIKSIAKSSYRTAKVIETVYPLAKCAKFETLDFSCAAASIADFPLFLIHLQGISIHQDSWRGRNQGGGGRG